MMDHTDRRLINMLPGGLPVVERPFAEVAASLGLDEDEVVERLSRLRADGVLSRFGPMFDAERLGGGLCLCAMAVPAARFDEVATLVNAFPQVAHNYAREHALNMWLVLATERPEEITETVRAIEAATGLAVLSLPKLEEYFLELRLAA
jgi:DNA-binding Lrp family transcriptional regulator